MVEREVYTRIGQFILDSITSEVWDYAYLHIFVSNDEGSFDYNGGSILQQNEVSLDYPDYDISNDIIKLKRFTEKNNFTKWNKIEFILNPDHSFNVKYLWDQKYFDELQLL